MTRPRIERIRSDYAPRYPRRLSAAEHAALIAPDQRGRAVAAAAAAATVALGSALPGQDRADGARTERVLELLTRATAGSTFWFEYSSFGRGKDPVGNPVVLPSIPISFGNSHNGVFDAGRARQLCRELFTIYGLKPEVDVAPDGVAARVDVYDKAQRVGAELRGQVPGDNEMWAAPQQEPDARALDDDELRQLHAKGHRIQTVDLDAFPLMDGDQFTPTLAYLAGIVAFLNEVTGGPDVDLAAILDHRRVRAPLGDPAPQDGVRVTHDRGTTNVHVEAAAAVTFVLDPTAGFERCTPPAERGRPATWAPLASAPPRADALLLQLAVHPAAPMQLEQDGDPPLRVEAPGAAAFLSRRYDPARPLRITLRLQPGRYMIQPFATLVGGR